MVKFQKGHEKSLVMTVVVRKSVLINVPHSWERAQETDTHKLSGWNFWGQTRGPERAIFGHEPFSFLDACRPFSQAHLKGG